MKELFLLPKFDNSSPSVTRDKSFVTWLWANNTLPPEAKYLMEHFEWDLPAVQI